jgi:hypothetical protein
MGLKGRMRLEGERLVGEFTPGLHHEGWPGPLHGGVIAVVVDEVLGRAVGICGIHNITGRPGVWLRRPVPLGAPFWFVADLVGDERRKYETCGQAFLPNGALAGEANGTFIRIPE